MNYDNREFTLLHHETGKTYKGNVRLDSKTGLFYTVGIFTDGLKFYHEDEDDVSLWLTIRFYAETHGLHFQMNEAWIRPWEQEEAA